jgi:hypothetical protein
VKFVPRYLNYTLLLPCVHYELTGARPCDLDRNPERLPDRQPCLQVLVYAVGVGGTLSSGSDLSNESATSSERGFSQPRVRTVLSQWAIRKFWRGSKIKVRSAALLGLCFERVPAMRRLFHEGKNPFTARFESICLIRPSRPDREGA